MSLVNNLVDEQSQYKSYFRMFVTQTNALKFYTRNQSLEIDNTVAFDAKSSVLSSLELFVASFISSYLFSIKKEEKKEEISLGEIEISISCMIKNPLQLLDVIGFEEEANIEALEGKIYIYSECDKIKVEELCKCVLEKSLIYKLIKPKLYVNIEPCIFEI